jgi:hypothetical protein
MDFAKRCFRLDWCWLAEALPELLAEQCQEGTGVFFVG